MLPRRRLRAQPAAATSRSELPWDESRAIVTLRPACEPAPERSAAVISRPPRATDAGVRRAACATLARRVSYLLPYHRHRRGHSSLRAGSCGVDVLRHPRSRATAATCAQRLAPRYPDRAVRADARVTLHDAAGFDPLTRDSMARGAAGAPDSVQSRCRSFMSHVTGVHCAAGRGAGCDASRLDRRPDRRRRASALPPRRSSSSSSLLSDDILDRSADVPGRGGICASAAIPILAAAEAACRTRESRNLLVRDRQRCDAAAATCEEFRFPWSWACQPGRARCGRVSQRDHRWIRIARRVPVRPGYAGHE